MTEKQKNLIIRAITGFFFVAVMITGFFRPESMVFLFTLIISFTVWEYTRLVNQLENVTVNRFISTMAGVCFFWALVAFRIGYVDNVIVFVPYILTIIYLFISELYAKTKNAVNDWAYTMLAQMYIVLPFSLISILAFEKSEDGLVHFDTLLPLSVFIFLWVNDTGAYCSGSLFGKHKLFPRISPGKTWEGSIGGGLFVLAAAAIIGYFCSQEGSVRLMNIPEWLGLGAVVAVFGTWGDLVESLFKRTLGIKDSGNILPGHGGMLDRFDSSLMAIPAAVIYLYTIQLL